MSARGRLARLGAAVALALASGVFAAGPAAAGYYEQSKTEDIGIVDTTGRGFTCRFTWEHWAYADGTAHARVLLVSGDPSCTTRNSAIRITSTWVDSGGETRQISSVAHGTWTTTQSMEDVAERLRSDFLFIFEACDCSTTRTLAQPK